MYCQVWWPILEIGPLHLTHPSAHTPGAVGSHCSSARGKWCFLHAGASQEGDDCYMEVRHMLPVQQGDLADLFHPKQTLLLSSRKEASGSEWICQILVKSFFMSAATVEGFETSQASGIGYHIWWASPGLFFLPNSPSLPLSTPNAFCVSFPWGSVESDSLQMWFIYRPVLHILSGLLRFPHWDRHR